MSGPAPAAEADGRHLAGRALHLLRNLPQRTRERAFWIVQAGVLGVTLLHLLVEWGGHTLIAGLAPAVHHLPVVLYLVPIAYASLRYGVEGAVLTGLWALVLTIPNILLWHRADLEWVTELVYVGAVVAAGVLVAVPVEREAVQRRLAEATGRRLATLNEVATLALSADHEHTIDRTLQRVAEVLPARAALLAVREPEAGGACTVLASHGDDPQALAAVQHAAVRQQAWPAEGRSARRDGAWLAAFAADLPDPGPAGRITGVVAVAPGRRAGLGAEEVRLLEAVANQLALVLATHHLEQRERERLRGQALRVTRAQEAERTRISRELHDEVAQTLVAMLRIAEAARRAADSGGGRAGDSGAGQAADALGELHELTAHCLQEVRRFSRDLRPPVLDDLGLASALESLVEAARHRQTASVDLAIDGELPALAPETELAVFRIAQSALHNVERHAAASEVRLELRCGGDELALEVADDGVGFSPPDDPAQLVEEGSLGLVGMRERAGLVGGHLAISSRPGSGTRVSVTVPASPQRRA